MARRTFFFDGGCRPNPGPMHAATVSGDRVWFRDHTGTGDSNEAEWLALLFAVGIAVEAGVTDVLFVGDSTLIVEQASGRWRCRSPHLGKYLAAFEVASSAFTRVRLKQVRRSKNLAGIALARRQLRGIAGTVPVDGGSASAPHGLAEVLPVALPSQPRSRLPQ